MKTYIDFNTEKRTNAANNFGKHFFKLMINSVWCNIMENFRKRSRLLNNEKDFLKYTSRPTHVTHWTFDKNYAAIHEIKPVLTLNKPIYVGFTVPELSKWLMYDFHSNFIKKQFDAKLLFTDTDSLTHEIKSEDVYEECFKNKYLFDFRNFSRNPKLYDSQNEMVVGKMKAAYRGIPIDKFVGWKSKIHSMLSVDGKESNTAKGVNIVTEFNEFRGTLVNKKVVRHKIKRIQGKKHKIGTYEINKMSLSCFDDKRFVLDDGIHTLAYFHKNLRKQIMTDDHKKRRDSKRFLQK